MDINLGDFQNICRICASSGKLRPLHENNLKVLLEKITDMKFTTGDMLPENICTLCAEELENIGIFIDKYKKNSIMFVNVLRLKEEITNHDDRDEYLEQEEDFVDDLLLSENDDPCPDVNVEQVVVNSRIAEALKDIGKIEQNDKQVVENGKCKLCGERLPLGGLKIHYQNSPECTPKCPICLKAVYPSSRLKSHVLAHRKKSYYKCPACKSIYPSERNLKKHVLQVHPDIKPFICKICKKGFLKKLSLDEHMNVHTGATPYICAYCGMAFQRAWLHAKHIYRSHNNDTQKIPKLKRKYTEKRVNLHLECGECGKVFASRSGFATHQLNHKGLLSFLCNLCGKKFVTNASLQAHILKHTGERPFKCTHCGKGFKTKFVLSKHEMLHNFKSFHCPDCDEQFQTKTQFNSHMMKHENHDTPLTCPKCPQKFYHKLILQNHLVSHRDKKRKECKVCNKSFAISYLSSHMRTHSVEKAYRCETCGKAFTISKSLKIHMRLHTGEQPYSCSVCYKRFSDRSNKNSHFKKCHGRNGAKNKEVALKEENV